jgi:hypothetical protein
MAGPPISGSSVVRWPRSASSHSSGASAWLLPVVRDQARVARLGIAGRAQQCRFDVHHAQLGQVFFGQLGQVHRAVHELLLRKHRQRHDALAATQLDRQALRVAHTRGHHFEHLGAAAFLLEAHQISLHRRAERRDARAGRTLGRSFGVQLFEIPVESTDPHQLGFTERYRRVEQVAVHQATILTLWPSCSQQAAAPANRGSVQWSPLPDGYIGRFPEGMRAGHGARRAPSWPVAARRSAVVPCITVPPAPGRARARSARPAWSRS